MIRIIHLAAVAIVIFTSFALYRVKYEAGEKAGDLAVLRSQIIAEKDTIAVLKAEWSHLNRPARLQALAGRYLALQPIGAQQIVTVQELPDRPAVNDPYGYTATVR